MLSSGVLAGVVIGVVLSLGWLVYVATRPPMPLLGREAGTQVFRDLDEHPEDETYPGIIVVRLDGGLFFATARRSRTGCANSPSDAEATRALVLDLEGVNFIDSQGAAKLAELHRATGAAASRSGSPGPSRRSSRCCAPTACSTGSARATCTATSTGRSRLS